LSFEFHTFGLGLPELHSRDGCRFVDEQAATALVPTIARNVRRRTDSAVDLSSFLFSFIS